jgi:hypothetical protein
MFEMRGPIETSDRCGAVDPSVAQVPPDSKADVSAGRRQKRVFKFSSIAAPGLKGFKERERSWRENRSARFGLSGVIQAPQTNDGSVPDKIFGHWMIVRMRRNCGNCVRGAVLKRNGAALRLGAGTGQQESQCYECHPSGDAPAPKSREDVRSIHFFSPLRSAPPTHAFSESRIKQGSRNFVEQSARCNAWALNGCASSKQPETPEYP